ncbi:MAG: hypothetical protein WBZ01_17195 [Terriglobales bacterium]
MIAVTGLMWVLSYPSEADARGAEVFGSLARVIAREGKKVSDLGVINGHSSSDVSNTSDGKLWSPLVFGIFIPSDHVFSSRSSFAGKYGIFDKFWSIDSTWNLLAHPVCQGYVNGWLIRFTKNKFRRHEQSNGATEISDIDIERYVRRELVSLGDFRIVHSGEPWTRLGFDGLLSYFIGMAICAQDQYRYAEVSGENNSADNLYHKLNRFAPLFFLPLAFFLIAKGWREAHYGDRPVWLGLAIWGSGLLLETSAIVWFGLCC